MRRGLAGLILGLALIVASVSWAGYIMTRTVLDPGRSERLADQLFENAELRSVLVGRLASGIGATLPGSIVVPDAALEQAADRALDDPAIQAIVRDGIVQTHRSALEGDVQPVALDGTAMGAALRDALIDVRPELDGQLPGAPVVSVELPTSGLNVLGTVRGFVERATLITGALALVGGIAALVVARDRPAVVRRVAFWAFGASVFWLIIGFGVPWLAAAVGPASAAIVTAVIDVFFGAMIQPAVIMGMVGGGLLAASYFWRAASLRRPALLAQPVRPTRYDDARRDRPKATLGHMSNIRPPMIENPTADAVPTSSPVDRTVVQPRPETMPRPSAQPGPTAEVAAPISDGTIDPHGADAASSPRQLRWVEGLGYVDDEGRPADQSES